MMPGPAPSGLAVVAAAPSADWTIDQGWDNYTPEEHAVWRTLFARQTKLLPDEVFFEHLASRRFPAGNFIRKADRLRPDLRSGARPERVRCWRRAAARPAHHAWQRALLLEVTEIGHQNR